MEELRDARPVVARGFAVLFENVPEGGCALKNARVVRTGRSLSIVGTLDNEGSTQVSVAIGKPSRAGSQNRLGDLLRAFEIDVGELVAVGHQWEAERDDEAKEATMIRVRVAAGAAAHAFWRLSEWFRQEEVVDRCLVIICAHYLRTEGPSDYAGFYFEPRKSWWALEASGLQPAPDALKEDRPAKYGDVRAIQEFVRAVHNFCEQEGDGNHTSNQTDRSL